MIHEQRVIFGDTDQMGIVYYANYYRYFEASRAALLRAHGHNHQEMLSWGVALPVVESHCRYHNSALYEDLLLVEVTVGEIRGASLRFDYCVRRAEQASGEETRLVTGFTRHACVYPNSGRPRRIPAELLAILQTEPG